MKMRLILLLLTIIILPLNSISAQENMQPCIADIAGTIHQLREEIKNSENKELRNLSRACENFLKDFYDYKAHIRFFPPSYKQNNIGLFYPHTRSIYLKRDISLSALRTTLIHELTHYKQLQDNPVLYDIMIDHFRGKYTPQYQEEVLKMEQTAHTNAMFFYEEFISPLKNKTLHADMESWEQLLVGYAYARERKEEIKFLKLFYN